MNAAIFNSIKGKTDLLDQDALDALLKSPIQIDDMTALDLIRKCWPRNTVNSQDDNLLLVAQNLTINFCLPTRMHMSSARAWRMLDPLYYETEFSEQLKDIIRVIQDWQSTRNDFLILEFGEIDLIEFLFESLSIAIYSDLLSTVMSFKALSLRRAGLLRRIPPRVERQLAPVIQSGRADLAMVHLSKVKDFIDRFTGPDGHAPIIEAARTASARIEKDMSVIKAAADSVVLELE